MPVSEFNIQFSFSKCVKHKWLWGRIFNVECWMLNIEFWILNIEFCIPNVEYCTNFKAAIDMVIYLLGSCFPQHLSGFGSGLNLPGSFRPGLHLHPSPPQPCRPLCQEQTQPKKVQSSLLGLIAALRPCRQHCIKYLYCI